MKNSQLMNSFEDILLLIRKASKENDQNESVT